MRIHYKNGNCYHPYSCFCPARRLQQNHIRRLYGGAIPGPHEKAHGKKVKSRHNQTWFRTADERGPLPREVFNSDVLRCARQLPRGGGTSLPRLGLRVRLRVGLKVGLGSSRLRVIPHAARAKSAFICAICGQLPRSKSLACLASLAGNNFA